MLFVQPRLNYSLQGQQFGMSGNLLQTLLDQFQATVEIRKLADPHKARVPIVAMTAHALKGDAERCLDAGMNAYLSKPLRASELVEMVERITTPGEWEPTLAQPSDEPA